MPAEENQDRFANLSDENVVALAQKGDEDAQTHLLQLYKRSVRLRARSYFLIGADQEDLVQEGMIGLFKAIRDFDPARQTSFASFAELCVRRQIITAIKTATRRKHIPLNSYISLNKPLYDEQDSQTLLDLLESRMANPEDMLIHQERMSGLREYLNTGLSKFEKDVLKEFLCGKSYQEIAEVLGKHVKGVDNALQRVKKKINKYLENVA